MPTRGDRFRDALVRYIESWRNTGIKILTEKPQDMKAKLIMSGKGIEVRFNLDDSEPARDQIDDPDQLFRQRVYMELGLDWFGLYQ